MREEAFDGYGSADVRTEWYVTVGAHRLLRWEANIFSGTWGKSAVFASCALREGTISGTVRQTERYMRHVDDDWRARKPFAIHPNRTFEHTRYYGAVEIPYLGSKIDPSVKIIFMSSPYVRFPASKTHVIG